MTLTERQLVSAHLDHAVRIPVNGDLTEIEQDILAAILSSPDGTVERGSQRAWLEHKTGRRAVHWREVVEDLEGPEYAEQVLAETAAGPDHDILVIAEIG